MDFSYIFNNKIKFKNMKFSILNVLLLSACGNTASHTEHGIEYRNDTSIVYTVTQANISDSGNLLQNDTTKKKAISPVSAQSKPIKIAKDSTLIDIQSKISQASTESFVSKDTKKLDEIEKKLDAYYKTKKNNLVLYWKSYLLYYKSIFYLTTNDMSNSEKVLDKGIQIMDDLANKNSDDLALLAMLRGLSFKFKAGIKAPFIADKIKTHLSEALELDSTNIRVYFVQGSNDFYTPKKYGGGKLVVSSLQKAISLPDQNIKNSSLPSWGKEEAYEMLINYYIKNNNWEDAKKYFAEANKLYPNNYRINQAALKLIGK